MIEPISSWLHPEEDGVVEMDEFFIKKIDFPILYQIAEARYSQQKSPFEPIEQLSPKGLALQAGTEVTVILQPTDSESPFFSRAHKTVCKLQASQCSNL